MGTPVGVVVVPSGFAPDGKARIISLLYVYEDGITSTSSEGVIWATSSIDTILTNFTKAPITDNTGNISTDVNDYGRLPSDKFTGATSFVDPKAKYNGSTPYAVSPYFGEGPNPEYYKTISGNNVLSDFNGLTNTETLVGLGTNYVAANAAWKYKDGASNLQWYLPAMGELGYLMPRWNEINNTLTALGGSTIQINPLWSSSEYNYDRVYLLNTQNGTFDHYYGYKRYGC